MSNGTVLNIVDLMWNGAVYGCAFADTPLRLLRGRVYEVVYNSPDEGAKVKVAFTSSEIIPASFVIGPGMTQKLFVSTAALEPKLGVTPVPYALDRIAPMGSATFTWVKGLRPPTAPPDRPDVEIDDP